MKPEVVFVLENAGWPAVLVNAASTILRANQAAVKTFGSPLEGALPLLSAIWSPENGNTAEQFLAQWERAPSPSVSAKLRVKGGGTTTYAASVCSCTQDGQKLFLLQLLPEPAPGGEPKFHVPRTPPIVHKQKLDCALQAGALGGPGFQQRADQRARSHVAAVEQGRTQPSVAQVAHGGGEVGGQGGGNRQRSGRVQPAGKGGNRRGRTAT